MKLADKLMSAGIILLSVVALPLVFVFLFTFLTLWGAHDITVATTWAKYPLIVLLGVTLLGVTLSILGAMLDELKNHPKPSEYTKVKAVKMPYWEVTVLITDGDMFVTDTFKIEGLLKKPDFDYIKNIVSTRIHNGVPIYSTLKTNLTCNTLKVKKLWKTL